MNVIYLVIWAHFVCDFVLQSDKMAQGKSGSNRWLGLHILVYTFVLFIGFLAYGLVPALKFAGVNGGTHFVIDYVTSRITRRLWASKQVHNFFVVIGADQALHMTILIATLPLLKAFQ